MKNLYKVEMIIALFAILALGLYMMPMQPNLTGYVAGANVTAYIQNLDLNIDKGQSYTLTAFDKNLKLKSFMIYGTL